MAEFTQEQLFQWHVANPNLLRTLAERLNDYSIFVRVGCSLTDTPEEEGSIGLDCDRAAHLLDSLADVIEESKE